MTIRHLGLSAPGGPAQASTGHNAQMKAIEDYVGSLGLDAYLVGGAVRDELLGRPSKDADFLVAGLDTDGLRDALSSHGRVDDLVVAGRPVVHASQVPYSCTTACVTLNLRASATSSIICSMSELRNSID